MNESIKNMWPALRVLTRGMERQYGWLFVLAILTAMLEVASIGLIFPLLAVVAGESGELLPGFLVRMLDGLGLIANLERLSMFLLVVFLLRNGLKFGAEYGNARITNEMRGQWMKALMRKYLDSHYLFFVRRRHGELVHNLFDLTVEALAGVKQLVLIGLNGVSMLVVVAGLFTISWEATVAALVVVLGLYAGVNRPLTRRAALLGKQRVGIYQDANALPAEAFKGMREIKTYFAMDKILRAYERVVDKMVRVRVRSNLFQILPTIFPEILLVTLLVGFLLYMNERDPAALASLLPVLGTYTYAVYRLFTNGSVLLRSALTLQTHVPSMEYLADSLVSSADPEVSEGGRAVPDEQRDILFDSVSFRYQPGQPVLDGASFTIPAISMTAIVGESGSGKSTTADLILRMLEPSGGAIRWGEEDISSFSLQEWRSVIGFVSQETFLFRGSIRENILFGLEGEVSEENMLAAAERAQAHQFIERLPDGYETEVGERGGSLSGGQRQRIAIARALVREPRILVLDEATSALDQGTERRLLEVLEGLKELMTIIFITHRLEACKKADQVIVMKDGRVEEVV